MVDRDTMIHLIAGGAGGTMGAIVTCPLEVVKTRLQSSVATFNGGGGGGSMNIPPEASIHGTGWTTCRSVHGSCAKQQLRRTFCTRNVVWRAPEVMVTHASLVHSPPPSASPSIGLLKCLKYIIEHEGPSALFKGLVPNLIGVAPSRAIYFCAYNSAKQWLNTRLVPESPLVHISAGLCAGFTSTTLTNPIWVIKTRLQLDQTRGSRYTASACIRDVFRTHGFGGFYKGVTASYWGISETVIHWVIYERLKKAICTRHHFNDGPGAEKLPEEFFEYMVAAAVSKTCAACLTYPHEVARTRMRQGTPKYRSFWPTLSLVFHEEGFRALYRGLSTQLVRQIPNSAIMLSTYEAVVYGLTRYYAEETEFYEEAPNEANLLIASHHHDFQHDGGWEEKKDKD